MRQAGWTFGLACLLLWPAFLSGNPLVYWDTGNYYTQGGAVLRVAGDLIGIEPATLPAVPATMPATGDGPSAGTVSPAKPAGDGAKSFGGNIRSLPYSVLLNASIRLAGRFAPVVLCALATAALAIMLMQGLGPKRRLSACLVLVAGSNIAFYSSELMPDILAAWLVAIPMILVLRGGQVRPAAAILLLAAATFATMAHYAHIPLAAIMGVAVFIWAWSRGWRMTAILAQVPLALTLAFNLLLSAALPGGGGPSIAPARYPILLARAIEDGVAVRYLEAHCDEDRFAICDVYDTFPKNVYDTLWDNETGLTHIAMPAQSRAIADQELPLLWQVFLFDPLAQTRALVANMADQVVRFGLGDVFEARSFDVAPETLSFHVETPRPRWFEVAAGIQYVTVGLAALALVVAWPRMTRPMRGMVAMGALGLLANAAICGGLSVPTDRYQGRIVWLVILAACIAWPGRRQPVAAMRQPGRAGVAHAT